MSGYVNGSRYLIYPCQSSSLTSAPTSINTATRKSATVTRTVTPGTDTSEHILIARIAILIPIV